MLRVFAGLPLGTEWLSNVRDITESDLRKYVQKDEAEGRKETLRARTQTYPSQARSNALQS
jgi:hypothetical protein